MSNPPIRWAAGDIGKYLVKSVSINFGDQAQITHNQCSVCRELVCVFDITGTNTVDRDFKQSGDKCVKCRELIKGLKS